jgi:nicotinamidase/pyrazinamidase
MSNSKIIFWNVDTQRDFVDPDGKLYVAGAEKLKPVWKRITDFAAERNIIVVNTADYHFPDAGEISRNPDYIHTFPPHCIAGTDGSGFVEETEPQTPLIINWDEEIPFEALQKFIENSRNIVILKNVFDMFAGNPNTDNVMKILNPETVIVYGVTTNVCVDFAVKGLAERTCKVYVISDAIKELPLIPLPFIDWEKLGVNLVSESKLAEIAE